MKTSYLIFMFLLSQTISFEQINNALHFDGTDDRVYVGNSQLFNTPHLTVQAWVKMDYIGGWSWRCVVTKRNCCEGETEQWTMQTTVGGFMDFFGYAENGVFAVQDPNPVPVGVWTNYTGTYDGQITRFYKNGELIAEDTNALGNIIAKDWPVVIGDRDDGLDWFPGSIDEVRIWDRALTKKEIQSNINCALTGKEPGLIAYYNFNQGVANGDNTTITTLFDKTSNHLNGTLQNFTLNGTTSNFVSDTISTSPCFPVATIANKSTLEGNTGTKQLKLPVTLSSAYSDTVKIKFKTKNNTAKAGSDYITTNGLLIFNPGETSKKISITINGDTKIEPDETFYVGLYNPENATIGDDTAIGTIRNDDGAALTSDINEEENVKSTSSTAGFTVYPNPVKNMLYIQTTNNTIFYLSDAKGKLILTKQVQNNGSIDVSKLPAGLYFLKNSLTGEVQKIVVEK